MVSEQLKQAVEKARTNNGSTPTKQAKKNTLILKKILKRLKKGGAQAAKRVVQFKPKTLPQKRQTIQVRLPDKRVFGQQPLLKSKFFNGQEEQPRGFLGKGRL